MQRLVHGLQTQEGVGTIEHAETACRLDADDAAIETKTFESVPIQAGYSTSYRGAFFITQGATMTFTAPDTWNSFDEETF